MRTKKRMLARVGRSGEPKVTPSKHKTYELDTVIVSNS